MFATKSFQFWYAHILKPILFKCDPELVHDIATQTGKYFGKKTVWRKFFEKLFVYEDQRLGQNIGGVLYKNPVGLAAGFDKNAWLTSILPSIGFGFAEVGSITWEAFEGNVKPRLWRLPEHKALRVNYGLKNDGARCIYERLQAKTGTFPIGINIAKTNVPHTSDITKGIEDYTKTFRLFHGVGDYFTINISCPNTCETTPIFAQPDNLNKLLMELQAIPRTKNLYIKLSPDLDRGLVRELVDVAMLGGADGFVCTNLTKKIPFQHEGQGGFSGQLVRDKSNRLIAEIFLQTKGAKIIIGCGGIFSAEDAYAKMKLGANLVQLITGMIYEGPQRIGQINQGLVTLMERDGLQSISEVVGSGVAD